MRCGTLLDSTQTEGFVMLSLSVIDSAAINPIERQLSLDLQQQLTNAARKGMTLDEYLEDLNERRDELLENLIHKRTFEHACYPRH